MALLIPWVEVAGVMLLQCHVTRVVDQVESSAFVVEAWLEFDHELASGSGEGRRNTLPEIDKNMWVICKQHHTGSMVMFTDVWEVKYPLSRIYAVGG